MQKQVTLDLLLKVILNFSFIYLLNILTISNITQYKSISLTWKNLWIYISLLVYLFTLLILIATHKLVIYLFILFVILFYLLQEYFIFQYYPLWKWTNDICLSSSLLLLFSLFVLFLVIWSGFSIIICEIYFFSEFDPILTLLNPWCFRFQWDRLNRELIQNIKINTRNHIGWLNKWKWKWRF